VVAAYKNERILFYGDAVAQPQSRPTRIYWDVAGVDVLQTPNEVLRLGWRSTLRYHLK
jgi:hypothetical protein